MQRVLCTLLGHLPDGAIRLMTNYISQFKLDKDWGKCTLYDATWSRKVLVVPVFMSPKFLSVLLYGWPGFGVKGHMIYFETNALNGHKMTLNTTSIRSKSTPNKCSVPGFKISVRCTVYSGPCKLRPLYLTIPCILRPDFSDTTCVIFSINIPLF